MKSHLLAIAILLSLLLFSLAAAQVFINEVELNPEQWEEFINYGDEEDIYDEQWIELYNSGNDEVDINGWSIASLRNPAKIMAIFSSNLSSKDFFVISFKEDEKWFDWRDETLILMNSQGQEVDRTPPLSDPYESDCTWGRYPDGSSNWIFQESTWWEPSSGKLCEMDDFESKRLQFDMDKKVNGSGFVNVRNSMIGVSGEDLESREHGSGSYECEENANYSSNLVWEIQTISLNKNDLSMRYNDTVLNVTSTRPVKYSSRWTESSMIRNSQESSYISELIKHAKNIDLDQQIESRNTHLTAKISSEFQGMGRIESKLADYASSEEYTGSFKVLANLKKKNSKTIESSTRGEGFVNANKEISDEIRTHERGTGEYSAEETIDTWEKSMNKNIILVHQPVSYAYAANNALNRSVRWSEGTRSGKSDILFVGTEFSDINRLEAETSVVSSGKVKTSAKFSGKARLQVDFKNPLEPSSGIVQNLDEYIGNYSIVRQVSIMPYYEKPHISVSSIGSIHKPGCDSIGYTVTLVNDGNISLGPVYLKDVFPPGTKFRGASIQPFLLASRYANWSIPVIGAGDSFTINLELQVIERKKRYSNVIGAATIYKDMIRNITYSRRLFAFNTSRFDADWSDCCPRNMSAAFTSTSNSTNPNILTYNLTVQNLAAENMSADIIVTLPKKIQFLNSSINPSQIREDEISWKAERLPSGKWINISFMGRASDDELLTSWANIRGSSLDGLEIESINISVPIMLGKHLNESLNCVNWLPCGDEELREMIGSDSWERTNSKDIGCLCRR